MGHDVKRDWRFTDQDQYLMDVRLKFCQFSKEVRDHDHCEFCGAKFSEDPGDLQRAIARPMNMTGYAGSVMRT